MFLGRMKAKLAFVILCMMLSSSLSYAQKTIWEEMPSSLEGRYSFFEKNDGYGVFKKYNEMRGTKLIFACVNAHIFSLFAYQMDSIKDEVEANKLVSNKCAEKDTQFSTDKYSMGWPLGTPLLLKFEKDYDAYDGYLESIEKWTFVVESNTAQIFIYKLKPALTELGYKRVWTLSNFDKNSEFASVVALRDFDCNLRQYKFMRIMYFEQKYGRGKNMRDSDLSKKSEVNWTVAVPNTVNETLVDSVCN
jgi:hypothetical protein